MKFDYKIIIILILLAGVIGMVFFWPSESSDTYKIEIENLHKDNKKLLNANDSLYKSLLEKDTIIYNANIEIEEMNKNIIFLDSSIQNINKERHEIRTNVNSLNNDAVSSGITDYLNRR